MLHTAAAGREYRTARHLSDAAAADDDDDNDVYDQHSRCCKYPHVDC